jgi:FtsZ-interacting cell division protein ZipA
MGTLDVPEVLIIVGLFALMGLVVHNWMYRHHIHWHK